MDEPKNFLEITEGNNSILLDQGIEVIRDSIEVEQETQLISLSVTWDDPKLAAEWSNDLVKQLNEQLRERAISDSQKSGIFGTRIGKDHIAGYASCALQSSRV